MVNVDNVEMASVAGIDELTKEIETGLSPAVGHSWGCKFSLALELVHVLLVYLGGLLGRQVGLAAVVRLVGTKRRWGKITSDTRSCGTTYEKSHFDPLLIAAFASFTQLLLLRPASTLRVGTNINELSRVTALPIARCEFQLEPKLI